MRSLPRIVSQIPNDLRNFLDRVREYLGEGGDDRFVTLRELRAGGVISTTPGGTITPPTEFGVETPTVPTGLATTGGLGCIFVEWDTPNYIGHSRTEVWGASTNVFANAVLLGTSPGVLYVDNIGSGGSRYYWVRFINLNEVAGPFNADAGVLGTAGTDPAYLVDILAGSITETELATELNDRINLIDGSASVTGTIPNQLALLQGQIDDLNATPEYDNATTYAIGDIVKYSGGLYQATAVTTGNLPTDTAYWTKIGDYNSLGDAVAAHTIDIDTLTTDLGAETTARELLATQMRGTYTGTDLSLVTSGLIYSERVARSDAISAEASSRNTLAAQIRGSYTGTDVTQLTAGLIHSESTVRANADSALASSISTLTTSLNNQTTSIQTLSQSVDGIKGLYTVKIDNNGSVGGFGLESVLDNVAIPLWTASTAFSIGAVRRISGVSTKVMRCIVAGTSDTVTPTMAGAVGTTFTDNTVTWEIASSTATSTFISNVDKFAVTTPTSSIPVRANSTAYTAGAFVGVASSTSKMLVCKAAGTSGGTAPNIASAAIGSLVVDGSVTWQVASRVPISVLTSSQIINGETIAPGVYIDGASIVNATITNAAIGTAAITDAKIADLSAGKITAGTMQVGAFIQSQSYVPGTSGWKINSDGTAEFAQAVIRGSIFGGSATAYATGTGLFAGLDAGTYKFRVGNPSGTRVTWDGSNLAIAGGSLTVGTSPAVSGTTMSGSGAAINSSGTFALGNSTTNISFNGSQLTLNGNVVDTPNVKGNAFSQMYRAEGLKQFFITSQPASPIAQVTNVVVPDDETGVLVIYSCQYDNITGATYADASWRIYRDNTFIEEPGGAVPYDTIFALTTAPNTKATVTRIFADIYVTPGTHSYQILRFSTWTTNPNNNLVVRDHALTCITFKR